MGLKNRRYPLEVFNFNELWRLEMDELNSILKNKGFKEQKKKPTYHPLHTERNECTASLDCCIDLFIEPEEQNIISQLLDTRNRGKEVVTIKPLPDE